MKKKKKDYVILYRAPVQPSLPFSNHGTRVEPGDDHHIKRPQQPQHRLLVDLVNQVAHPLTYTRLCTTELASSSCRCLAGA